MDCDGGAVIGMLVLLVGKKSIEGTFAWEDADMSVVCKAFVPLPRQMIN